MIGYPNGHFGVILPARDYPLYPSKISPYRHWQAILTKLVRSITHIHGQYSSCPLNFLCYRLEPTRPITLHQKALFLLWLSIIFLWVTLKTKRYILKWRDKWKAKQMEDEEKDLAEKGMNLTGAWFTRNGEAILLWASDSVSDGDLRNQALQPWQNGLASCCK